MTDCDLKYACVSVILVLCSLLIVTWTRSTEKKKGVISLPVGKDAYLAQLASDAKQVYFLAKQDQNPLMSLVHLCTSVAKLNCLTSTAPEDDIFRLYDLDAGQLRKNHRELQKDLTHELNTLCPSLSLPAGLVI
jgi:hypothetical protein